MVNNSLRRASFGKRFDKKGNNHEEAEQSTSAWYLELDGCLGCKRLLGLNLPS